ncbi:MAG: hypothetical protein H0V37_09340, partial [Chloroflexia bacterium]|nr:hypothetical protein [Chloroflexia bacterium]
MALPIHCPTGTSVIHGGANPECCAVQAPMTSGENENAPRDTRSRSRWGPARRRELIANTDGIDIAAGAFRLRVSNVPLYRVAGGALLQGIRLRIEETGYEAMLDVSIRLGDVVLDMRSIATGATATEFLFVPEVTSETTHAIEVASGVESLAAVPFLVVPQRKWTIHLVHHSHYDIGYTDTQVDVLASQLTFIDDALEMVAATDHLPEEARFRWSIEVAWPLRHWLRTRPKSAIDELVRRVCEGRIEINALPFSSLFVRRAGPPVRPRAGSAPGAGRRDRHRHANRCAGGDGRVLDIADGRRDQVPRGRPQLRRTLDPPPDRRPGPDPPFLPADPGRRPGAHLVHRYALWLGVHGGPQNRSWRRVRRRAYEPARVPQRPRPAQLSLRRSRGLALRIAARRGTRPCWLPLRHPPPPGAGRAWRQRASLPPALGNRRGVERGLGVSKAGHVNQSRVHGSRRGADRERPR